MAINQWESVKTCSTKRRTQSAHSGENNWTETQLKPNCEIRNTEHEYKKNKPQDLRTPNDVLKWALGEINNLANGKTFVIGPEPGVTHIKLADRQTGLRILRRQVCLGVSFQLCKVYWNAKIN